MPPPPFPPFGQGHSRSGFGLPYLCNIIAIIVRTKWPYNTIILNR